MHSTMGKWISNLADHFDEVGLLVHVTVNRTSAQDTCIANENVILHSMGAPGNMWDKIQRTNRIRKACRELDRKYDTLLVRGITPRQRIIWNNISVKTSKKYFLMVGSIENNYSLGNLQSLASVYHYYMERYRRLELKSMLKSGDLLVNAPNLREEAMAIMNNKAVFTPTNTISHKEFSHLEVRRLNNPVRLFFCGRIEVKKGIVEAIHAVSILEEEGYEFQFDLVGPFVDDKFLIKAKLLIGKLNISNRIIFHGGIPYGDILFKYYREADIFILPSYTEGFPHVIWEAAANCCPVITTSVGGIPSLFKHRKHGILIPPQNHRALANSIIELINEEQLRTKLVTNAYKLVQEYTVEKCAEKVADVIS